MKNVSVLVAIGVAQSEGAKEDKAGWTAFLRELKERGLGWFDHFLKGDSSICTAPPRYQSPCSK